MAVKKVSSNELHTINLKIVSVRQSKKAASHWMRMNQFGPWLRTIAPKVNKKKGNVNQTNPSVDDDY